MIECEDIQRAVGGLLRDNGFSVIALEAQSGAKKPFCCVEVFPSEWERTGQFIQEDTFSVSITYYPRAETNEELLKTAKTLKNILAHTPFDIEDRCVETFDIKLNRADTVLTAVADYTVEQFCESPYETDGEMAELEFRIYQESK